MRKRSRRGRPAAGGLSTAASAILREEGPSESASASAEAKPSETLTSRGRVSLSPPVELLLLSGEKAPRSAPQKTTQPGFFFFEEEGDGEETFGRRSAAKSSTAEGEGAEAEPVIPRASSAPTAAALASPTGAWTMTSEATGGEEPPSSEKLTTTKAGA